MLHKLMNSDISTLPIEVIVPSEMDVLSASRKSEAIRKQSSANHRMFISVQTQTRQTTIVLANFIGSKLTAATPQRFTVRAKLKM